MMRTIFSKVVWVGGVASTVFGLALVLALIFGLTTAAFGANGDLFKLGKSNTATKVSKLINNGTGSALGLQVQPGNAPMTVNSGTQVANLNADKVDGKNATDLQLGCPSGSQLFGGVCIGTTNRPGNTVSVDFQDASSTCAQEGGRLPTAAELEGFRQQPGITLGEGAIVEWSADFLDTSNVLTVSDSGVYGASSTVGGAFRQFRCVTSPSG